jgi:hypothetical protein
MLWILLILTAVLLLGPLRRPYLRHAAYTLPFTAGFIGFFLFGIYVMGLAGVSAPYSFLIPAAMGIGAALGLGERCKAWRDETFGSRRENRDGPPDHPLR